MGNSETKQSKILLIIRKNIDNEYILEYDFKNQIFSRKLKEIVELGPDKQNNRRFSIIYQVKNNLN